MMSARVELQLARAELELAAVEWGQHVGFIAELRRQGPARHESLVKRARVLNAARRFEQADRRVRELGLVQ